MDLNFDKYNVRTDLADEAISSKLVSNVNELIQEEYKYDKIVIRKTVISKGVGEQIGKKEGLYYSLDISEMMTHDHDDIQKCEDALTHVIKEVLKEEKIDANKRGLIVGLGNINVTPDSLGPLAVDNVIVTRHMFLLNPAEISDGISDVSAIAPGVMGTTGIETVDIVEAVVNKIEVDYVIVIDSLASRSLARVNKAIQVTNTGISPGSGVGNKRKELSKESIHIPVIAVGVPTVVDAVTIASDTIDFLLKFLDEQTKTPEKGKFQGLYQRNFNDIHNQQERYRKEFMGEVGLLDEVAKRKLFDEVLTPSGFNMMVTPKEVDIDIENLSTIISGAIDRSLHTIVNHN